MVVVIVMLDGFVAVGCGCGGESACGCCCRFGGVRGVTGGVVLVVAEGSVSFCHGAGLACGRSGAKGGVFFGAV